MELHDWTSGSRDCGRAQITQICAHTGGTVTRQSAAPNGGSACGYHELRTSLAA